VIVSVLSTYTLTCALPPSPSVSFLVSLGVYINSIETREEDKIEYIMVTLQVMTALHDAGC